jgi:hypothetical protein
MQPEKSGSWVLAMVRVILLTRSHFSTVMFSSDLAVPSSPTESEANGNASATMWYGETETIDSETVVVDSIGQRLTLHIDNVIGGGGQRFISLFCPYWVRHWCPCYPFQIKSTTHKPISLK